MGRELKRVPLDFDWPLNKPWKGYINLLHCAEPCAACGGDGYSRDARALKDRWYGRVSFRPEDRGSVPLTPACGPVRAFAERNVRQAPEFYGTGEAAIERESRRLCKLWNGQWSHHLNDDDVAALVAADRLWDFTRDFVSGVGWKDKTAPTIPAAREVNLWSIGGIGHDSINCGIVIRAECKRLGIPEQCQACGGEGEIWPSVEAKAAYDAWQSEEPPAGDGYQIWETVSEGSPISPPFSTPEDLARHMATTKWGADDGTPYETWLAFIRGPGWAPSMISNGHGMRTGVQAVVEQVF